LTVSYSGFVNGDTAASLTTAPTVTTTGLATSPVGTYPITASGAVDANYTIGYVAGTLTIEQASSDTVLVSSENPSVQGSNVTFTATVAPIAPTTITPAGSIQFYTNGVVCGGPRPLSGGVASITLANLPIGSTTVDAAYESDGNFLGSIDSLEQVVHGPAETPITVSIDNNGDGTVTVHFIGTPNAQYVVQASSNVSTPDWENISTNTAGADGKWTFSEPTGNHPVRFYRSAIP
jgi:hypothetical protein